MLNVAFHDTFLLETFLVVFRVSSGIRIKVNWCSWAVNFNKRERERKIQIK